MCKHVASLTCAQAQVLAIFQHLSLLSWRSEARSHHPVARTILRLWHYGCYCYVMFNMRVDACIVRPLPYVAVVIVLNLFLCLLLHLQKSPRVHKPYMGPTHILSGMQIWLRILEMARDFRLGHSCTLA